MKSSPNSPQVLREFCVVMFRVLEALGEVSADQVREFGERLGTLRSVSVLRQVVGDLLEWTQDLSGEALASVDALLTAQGLPSLTVMRDARERRIVEVIARGRIRTAEEYRMLTERLTDVGTTSLPECLREQAAELLGAWSGASTE